MDDWFKKHQQTLFSRLTLPGITKEQVLTDLQPHYQKIIVSEEKGAKVHFHVLLTHSDSNSKNANQNFKNLLLKLYPQIKGNASYAITETRQGTLTRLAAYTVKDGNYISHGFSLDEQNIFKAISYKKYTKQEFSKTLSQIVEDWITTNYDTEEKALEDLTKSYLKLKVEYNQNLNYSTIVNYINLVHAKKYGTQTGVDAVMTKFFFQRGISR